MSESSVVIVGASLAGLRTAEGLRAAGHPGPITLVGAEEHLPYTRPPLSKQILRGDWEPEKALLRSQEKLDALDLSFELGVTATGLDPAARTVSLADGRRLGYDDVVIATGSAPVPFPGSSGLGGVHVLRTLEDSAAIGAPLRSGADVVIIGAGFIGLEVAAAAVELGCRVTVVEALAAPLMRGLGADLGAIAADIHRARGVDLRLGTRVDGLEGEEAVTGVRLEGGEVLPAAVVVVGIGARPVTSWLDDSGLTINNGVVCDASLAAVGVEGVWAAGDVARWYHQTYGELVRFEHWTVAADHGKAVADNIVAGSEGRTPHTPVPYVWSDQYDVKIQLAGRVLEGDRLEIAHGEVETAKFVALSGDDAHVRGAVGFSRPRQLMSLMMRMEDGALPWDEARERLAG